MRRATTISGLLAAWILLLHGPGSPAAPTQWRWPDDAFVVAWSWAVPDGGPSGRARSVGVSGQLLISADWVNFAGYVYARVPGAVDSVLNLTLWAGQGSGAGPHSETYRFGDDAEEPVLLDHVCRGLATALELLDTGITTRSSGGTASPVHAIDSNLRIDRVRYAGSVRATSGFSPGRACDGHFRAVYSGEILDGVHAGKRIRGRLAIRWRGAIRP